MVCPGKQYGPAVVTKCGVMGKMRYCSGCGFPVPYGRFLEWTSDGTILGKESNRTRIVYLDVGEIQNILSGVSEWMGVPIDRIVYRAEKEVGRRFIKALMPSFVSKAPRSRIVRPQITVKAFGNYVFNYMGGLGMGRAEVLEYRTGERARVRVTDSHCIPLIAGDGAGVFEHLERVGVEAQWERLRTDDYLLSIEKISDEPGQEQRLSLEAPEYIKGNLDLDKCRKCGVPLAVTNSIYLDLDRGILRNKITGIRVVALPAQSFDAVFRELAREFGSQLPSRVENLELDYVRDTTYITPDMRSYGIGIIFSDFGWKGIGNPVSVAEKGEGLEVVVENPFHNEMVAGRCAGLYEVWTGKKAEHTWAEEYPGRVRVSIQRKAGS